MFGDVKKGVPQEAFAVLEPPQTGVATIADERSGFAYALVMVKNDLGGNADY